MRIEVNAVIERPSELMSNAYGGTDDDSLTNKLYITQLSWSLKITTTMTKTTTTTTCQVGCLCYAQLAVKILPSFDIFTLLNSCLHCCITAFTSCRINLSLFSMCSDLKLLFLIGGNYSYSCQ